MLEPTVSKLIHGVFSWLPFTHILIFHQFRQHLPFKHENWLYLAKPSWTAVAGGCTPNLTFSIFHAIPLRINYIKQKWNLNK